MGDIEHILGYIQEALENVQDAGKIYPVPILNYQAGTASCAQMNQYGLAQIYVTTLPIGRSGEKLQERLLLNIDALSADKCGAGYGAFADRVRSYALAVHRAFSPYAATQSDTRHFVLTGDVTVNYNEPVALDKDSARAHNYSKITFTLTRNTPRGTF